MKSVAEMPVSSVTVSAICRDASISRNAFYLHHGSVLELYATLIGELVDDVRAECLASAERRSLTGADDEFYGAIIGSLARHERLLRALLPSDDGSLAKCLAEGLEEAFVEAALRFGEHGKSFDHRLNCAYSAWALIGLATRWIAQTDQPLTESLARFRQLHASAVDVSVRYLMGEPNDVS
ncbi:MAG: hypothetical protein J6D34_04780 [Atopobiaceae bacterium]|nr:hypothetical protein [Atopobiaceae bacterium]